jgi:hypothetical protein
LRTQPDTHLSARNEIMGHMYWHTAQRDQQGVCRCGLAAALDALAQVILQPRFVGGRNPVNKRLVQQLSRP